MKRVEEFHLTTSEYFEIFLSGLRVQGMASDLVSTTDLSIRAPSNEGAGDYVVRIDHEVGDYELKRNQEGQGQ